MTDDDPTPRRPRGGDRDRDGLLLLAGVVVFTALFVLIMRTVADRHGSGGETEDEAGPRTAAELLVPLLATFG